MKRKDLHRNFSKNESGAVATTYGLALIGLIVVMGVGYDYGRVMGMDSELQNGADQAALAGATQLNRKSGACSRASAAIVNLLTNRSILTSDNKAVTVPSEPTCDSTGQIRFWQDKAKTQASTADANANYVEVLVDVRTVDYAFLPLTGLLTSANMRGIAMAGLGSAICKLPPVMMCNPNESTDFDFTIANYVGKGIRLVANVNGQNGAGEDSDEDPGGYGPGVFGYLETDAGSGAIDTARTLGREEIPGNCVAVDGADVKPGQQVSVLDALNVRFGIYANGLNNVCDTDNGLCPPSDNARIDLVREVPPGGSSASCAIGPGGWEVGPRPYRPTSLAEANAYDSSSTQPMGYPRDKCHAVSLAGACTGNGNARIGDGDWDRAAYYATNGLGSIPSTTWPTYGYPEQAGRTEPTRFQQYRYEYEDFATRLPRQTFQHTRTTPPIKTVDYEHQGRPFCEAPGIAPGSTPDRRIISIAVINCDAESVGASTTDATITKWVDVFLVEPTARRTFSGNRYTNNSDVYVEVVGATTLGGGGTQGQEIRKDVPYLIE